MQVLQKIRFLKGPWDVALGGYRCPEQGYMGGGGEGGRSRAFGSEWRCHTETERAGLM